MDISAFQPVQDQPLPEGSAVHRRYNVFIGQPTYDGSVRIESGLAAVAQASDGRHTTHYNTFGTSLLAMTFNVLWSKAVEQHLKKGNIDLFAMIHSDIVPEGGWLNKMVSIMEDQELDVISAVSPIKDWNGLTSTAVNNPTDPWSVRRITIKELDRLPETFTSDDVGGPLLVNTGLFVCRLGRWCRDICFTINDKIEWDDDDTPHVRVQPEDWNFSRDLARMGKRYAATKAVSLKHLGHFWFTNSGGWGNMDQDIYSDPKLPCSLGEIKVERRPSPI